MKIKEIRSKSVAELEKLETKLRGEVESLKIEQITKDDKNFRKSRNLRKDLARVLSVKNEMQNASDNSSEEKK